MICDYKQLTETLEVPGITAREVMALYSNVVIALKDSAVCVVAKEMAPSLVRTTKTTHFVIALTVVDVTNVHMDIYEYNPIIVKGEN